MPEPSGKKKPIDGITWSFSAFRNSTDLLCLDLTNCSNPRSKRHNLTTFFGGGQAMYKKGKSRNRKIKGVVVQKGIREPWRNLETESERRAGLLPSALLPFCPSARSGKAVPQPRCQNTRATRPGRAGSAGNKNQRTATGNKMN